MRKAFRISLVLLIVYSVVLLKTIKFDNRVPLSGDGWEYQSVAVNWAKGYGLMKNGAVAGDYYDDYKFYQEVDEVYQPTLQSFKKRGAKGGFYSFYRTPGYIVFLGVVYKLFGVLPILVKKIQLVFIAIIAAFLPLILLT